ncbi:hypothetical protein GGX14DRAFT_565481 [Mycena pura]|uniref:Uncharacterized protein n=1 Tax=Mycena pura TaxID=153505 RepID=A0AAD6VF39_9AGAR|nr:hypothetical protein GGX14DRAFT_565481 [Mycena pura]
MSSVDGSIPPFKSLCSGIKSGHITVSNTVLEHPTGYLNLLLSPLLSPSSNMLFALKALLLAGLVAHSALAAPTPFPVNARALLPSDGRPLPARVQPNGNGTTPADEVASANAAIAAAIEPDAMAVAATDKEVQVMQSDGDGALKSERDGAKRPLVDSGGALEDPALNDVLHGRFLGNLLGGLPIVGGLLGGVGL